jgi:hypothetical protein
MAFLARNRLGADSIGEVVAEIRDLVVDPLRLAGARARNSP